MALGARAQLIVLKEYQPLLDYLNRGTVLLTSRVGFIAIPDRTVSEPLSAVTQNDRFVHLQLDPWKLPDLSSEPGVVMRADGLVVSDRGIVGLASSVLADTWVVESMEVAVRLATGRGAGLRFVSQQGELLEANGTLYVGTIRSETSLLSRKSELRRLKNDLISMDREIHDAEQALQTMYQSLTGADSELESAAAELDYANQRFADLKAELTAQDQTLDRLRREQQSLELQLQTGSESLAEQEAELKQAEQHALETESELNQLAATLESAGEELLVLERNHREIEQQRSDDQLDLVKQGERLEGLKATVIRLDNELQQRIVQHEEADRRFATSTTKKSQIVLQILNTRGIRDEIILQAEQIQSAAMVLDRENMQLRTERSAIVEEELGLRKQRRERGDRQHTDEIRLSDMNHALVNLNERLEEEYQLKLADVVESGESSFALFREERSGNGPGGKRKNRDSHDSVAKSPTAAIETDATDVPEQSPSDEAEGIQADEETAVVDDHEEPQDRGNLDLGELRFEDIRPEIEARVNRLRKQLKLMGAVNTDSLRDLEMLETRYTQLAAQLQDLVEARQTLEEIIRKINSESRRLFAETFETIRKNFQELFRQVFGGGEGDIILEDPDDVLDCGIDIAARPPGKELRSISLLSGGEKTMTAIALIMSIFKSKPSPFCILDEVDAALDEANVERFTAVVKAFQTTTQFIMITHHKRSMTVADVLYGVTMEESGISKRMSVRFEDVSDDGNFKPPPQTSAA